MRLRQLLAGFDIIPGDANPEITGITEDSRRVRPGALFVAVRGTSLDGHGFMAEAIGRGAAAVVAERTGALPLGVPVIRVPSSREALAVLAARYFGTIGTTLSLIGFTGTFGKTSTSEILRRLLDASGMHTGVIGSLGARYAKFFDPGEGLTTPAPVELHRALRDLENAGATTVILEVTSHALTLGRVEGLRFSGGLLAAVMPGEHTDYHRSYEDYIAAKRLFLDYLGPESLLAYDADNLAACQLAASGPVRHIGFSIDRRDADINLRDVTVDRDGARFELAGPVLTGNSSIRMHSPLLGAGHLRNVALALAYALGSGLPPSAAEEVLSTLTPLPRRMERYEIGGRTILDDTAGHPDSLRAAFEVAALLPHRMLAVVYAIRGGRGVDINKHNALALADMSFLYGVESLIITSAGDVTSPPDVALASEIDAARQTLVARGRRFVWHDALDAALREALNRTSGGDLIVLLGAQAMNRGKDLLQKQ
jgi:UDP-N-acetylmuramoyl-L-alanyl-D-glutamate--2,6-diaminopimelate ligase